MSTRSSPRSASSMRPGPTSRPASRSTRPKVTRWRVRASLTRRRPRPRARASPSSASDGVVADEVEVLVVLQDGAERLLDDGRVELLAAEGDERLRPVDRLGHARRLGQVEVAQPGDERRRLGGQPLGHAGHAQAQDLDLALERRVRDPVKQAAALERVVQLARAVGGEDDRRAARRRDGPDLGDRDLEVGEHLEQEGLELVVGAVDLVDEQDDGLLGGDRLQQRPADEELGPEELLLVDGALLRGADVQQLAGVVPLVDGVGDVEALVALQADQPGAAGAAPAPWPARSCRRPPRPPGAAASRSPATGRRPSPGPAGAGRTARRSASSRSPIDWKPVPLVTRSP